MKKLEATVIRRVGVTGGPWSEPLLNSMELGASAENWSERIAVVVLGPKAVDGYLVLKTELPQRESGTHQRTAEVEIRVGTPAFAAILAAMSAANRQAAMEAMAEELLLQIRANRS